MLTEVNGHGFSFQTGKCILKLSVRVGTPLKCSRLEALALG